MLKQSSPNHLRQRAGMFSGIALAILLTGSVYAASAPQEVSARQQAPDEEYELQMQLELSTDDGHQRHAQMADLALCTLPGKAAMASVGELAVQATTVPLDDRQLRIDLAVGQVGAASLAHSQLQGMPGQPLHAAGKTGDGHAYVIDLTIQPGCPSRAIAEASPVKVTEHIVGGTARAAAESIAKKAGWTLVNPDALGQGAVTLSFNQMPAGTALQRVAKLAGVTMHIDGNRVRFEQK